MYLMPTTERTRISRPLWVALAAPVALCALLLTGCTGGGNVTEQPGSTSQHGDSAPDGGDSGQSDGGQSDGGQSDGGRSDGGRSDGEVDRGGIKVDTKIPDNLPDDLPLPQKAPTSVVTVGDGIGKVGGGVSLNYDGVSIDEVEQMLEDAELAGYRVDGPFEIGSSESWALRKDTVGVTVLFSDEANLSLTVTSVG